MHTLFLKYTFCLKISWFIYVSKIWIFDMKNQRKILPGWSSFYKLISVEFYRFIIFGQKLKFKISAMLSSFADLGCGGKEKGSRKMSQCGRSLEIGAHQPGSRNFNKLWNEVILMSRQKRQQLEKKKGKLRNVMNLRGAPPKKRRVRYLHYANGLSTRGIPSKHNVDVCNICIG